MPANVVKNKGDERAWSEAKKIAAEEGKANNWGYIERIYQRIHKREGNPAKGLKRKSVKKRSSSR